MHKLKLTNKAKKELKNLKKSYRITISLILEEIKENPSLGKPLGRDLLGRLSYRVGVFRIIYIINQQDQLITIISAGHRSKVYD